MKMVSLLALVSIMVWSALVVKNVSAESGTEPERVPVMKRYTGAQGQDLVTRRLESITKALGLSVEQQAEIRPVLLDDVAKLKDIRGNTNQTSAEKKAKMQELRDATHSKIRSLLTAEQQIKHDELLKKISERREKKESKGSTVIPTR